MVEEKQQGRMVWFGCHSVLEFFEKRRGKGQKTMGNEGPTITQPIETYGTSMGVGKPLAVEGVEGAIMVKDEK